MLKRFITVLTVFALFGGLTFAAEVSLSGGPKVATQVGQRIEGPATVTTASGDQLIVAEGGAIQVLKPEGDVELFLVKRGVVRGTIGGKTQVAGPNAWLMARPGEYARFYLEANGKGKGFVKVDEGQALFVVDNIFMHLVQGNGVGIERTPNGSVRFATHQTNAAPLRMINRVTDELEIDLLVPKATSGAWTLVQNGRKTRISSSATSWKSGLITLETRMDGEAMHKGSLGPGTFAVIDNSTGILELAFDEVEFQIIERAASLTSELSSLAVSNFFGDESPAND